MSRVLVDFKEVLNLDHKVGGFVAKIVSPKGIRHQDEATNRFSYSLDTDVAAVGASEGEVKVEPGLFNIVDITKWDGFKLQWNIYIVCVTEDGEAFPVAEYLNNPNTEWVKEARPLVKAFFDGEALEAIELTPRPKKTPQQSFGNHMNKPTSKPSETKKVEKASSKSESPTDSKQKTPQATNTSPTKSKAPAGGADDSKKANSTKKKPAGRSQEITPLNYGEARLMTFTGMIIGVCPITRHNKKFVEVQTNKGLFKFSKEDGKQIDAEKPRFANKIEFNLDKEE